MTRIATTEAATLRMVPNALDEASARRYASRALGSWTWRGEAYCHADLQTVADALGAWLARQAGRAA